MGDDKERLPWLAPLSEFSETLNLDTRQLADHARKTAEEKSQLAEEKNQLAAAR